MSRVAGKLNKNISTKKSKNIKIKLKKSNAALAKPKAKTHKAKKSVQEKELIIIDEKQGLIFENEKTLFGFFSAPIKEYEKRFEKNYNANVDYTSEQHRELETYLEETLDDPDEIWVDDSSFEEFAVHTLVKTFETTQSTLNYIAVVYINTEENYPTFVFMHFPTKDEKLLEAFRKNEIIFHKKLETIQFAAIEGDSLLEGDYLAIGLLESMLKVRSEKDIPADKFMDFKDCRDSTIDAPDEIWRKVDSTGHVLVAFIREFTDMGVEDLHYIVVTEEDSEAQVNSLLFSFPTNDTTLVDRYRQGENLEAEEVATESSH